MSFENAEALRKWFAENAETEKELLLVYYKVRTGTPSVTWPESVDEALAVGWVDGVTRRIDDERYMVRFTPRRPGSVWSKVNLAKVEKLRAEGRMTPAGELALANIDPRKVGIYSFENPPAELSSEHEARLREDEAVWERFSRLAPSKKRELLWWISTAKAEATKERRFAKMLHDLGEPREPR